MSMALAEGTGAVTKQTADLQKSLDQLWTTQDLCSRFASEPTAMTIFTWRRDRGLPFIKVPGTKRDTIRFVPNDVKAWARKNGLKLRA